MGSSKGNSCWLLPFGVFFFPVVFSAAAREGKKKKTSHFCFCSLWLSSCSIHSSSDLNRSWKRGANISIDPATAGRVRFRRTLAHRKSRNGTDSAELHFAVERWPILANNCEINILLFQNHVLLPESRNVKGGAQVKCARCRRIWDGTFEHFLTALQTDSFEQCEIPGRPWFQDDRVTIDFIIVP